MFGFSPRGGSNFAVSKGDLEMGNREEMNFNERKK
jgi:hypothetical protein